MGLVESICEPNTKMVWQILTPLLPSPPPLIPLTVRTCDSSTVQLRLSEPHLSERSIIGTNCCSHFYDVIANNSSYIIIHDRTARQKWENGWR